MVKAVVRFIGTYRIGASVASANVITYHYLTYLDGGYPNSGTSDTLHLIFNCSPSLIPPRDSHSTEIKGKRQLLRGSGDLFFKFHLRRVRRWWRNVFLLRIPCFNLVRQEFGGDQRSKMGFVLPSPYIDPTFVTILISTVFHVLLPPVTLDPHFSFLYYQMSFLKGVGRRMFFFWLYISPAKQGEARR